MSRTLKALVVIGSLAATLPALAKNTVIVGGKEMLPTRTIVENALNSADHTTLVTAVKAAGLVDTLMGKGPFTVFAPVNSAFAALPAGTVETLLKPENKDKLTGVLTYHVVAGRVTFNDLKHWIRKGSGTAELKTVAGGKLWATMNGPNNVLLKDETGNWSNITISDVMQSNGVIHAVDRVLLPKS